YRAFVKQIEDCKKNISNFETDELMVLEEMDAQTETLKQTRADLDAANHDKATALSEIDERETNLQKQIGETEILRAETAAQIDEDTLDRYDRLLKKGRANIVVDVEHGACGGCHMKLPTSDVANLKSSQEVNYCPNCSCIIYYTRDMNLESAGA
ncbi:MAG: zinc ribbon domain-containing protein, partial [Limisphaerales bacterium]